MIRRTWRRYKHIWARAAIAVANWKPYAPIRRCWRFLRRWTTASGAFTGAVVGRRGSGTAHGARRAKTICRGAAAAAMAIHHAYRRDADAGRLQPLLWRDLRNTRRTLRHTHAQLEQVQAELVKKDAELAEAKMVRDLLHAPDAWPLTLVSKKTAPQPQIKTVYSKQQGALLLMASNLTPLPENKIYQLWLLPADGSAPMPAGWFKLMARATHDVP